MKIRVLAGALDNGAGSHAYNLQLSRRLAQRGHEVSVICFHAPTEIRELCDVVQVDLSARQYHLGCWRFSPALKYMAAYVAIGNANLKAVDVVIGAEHLFLKPHHRIFRNTSFIYLPHSVLTRLEIDSYKMSGLLQWTSRWVYEGIQRWAVANADCIMRFTPWGANVLSAEYGAQISSRTVVNLMPIEGPAKVTPEARSDQVRLLFVGRIVKSKNLHFVLHSLAAIHNRSWHFVVVGDGPDRSQLQMLAKRLKIDGQVQFVGHQECPGEWYRKCDLLVFPSKLESCGMVVLEAMAHAVPCLVLKADGHEYVNPFADMIEHGRTGLIAESEKHFQNELKLAIQSPEYLATMGRAARCIILQRHTWDRHLDVYEGLFEQLMKNRYSRLSAV